MLPPALHNLTTKEMATLVDKVRESYLAVVGELQLGNESEQDLVDLYLPLAATLRQKARSHDGPLLVGVNGAQGAGKSTLCRLLQTVLERGFAQRVTCLSIDDLYRTRAERRTLADTVHPLFATRGVPGTHDVALGRKLIATLRSLGPDETCCLPRFDKAQDDRCPERAWEAVEGPLDIILFEGWCVGARSQSREMLIDPVNSLEREEDSDRVWRCYVNQQLEGDYADLFAELDLLLMLQVPGMQSIFEWRGLQEKKLAAATGTRAGTRVMDDKALQRFIMHYERLTRWMLDEMQDRADLVLELNDDHRIEGVRINNFALVGEA